MVARLRWVERKETKMTRHSRLAVLLLAMLTLTAAIHADCTLQLSEEGVVRLASGEQQTLSWTPVPGATSYYVESLIEGLNEPSGPDFMFGAPYTESRNF